MTQHETILQDSPNRGKPLWPLAALILAVVFAPACLAAMVMLLRH